MRICVFQCKPFKNGLEGLENYSVDLGKCCELALEEIASLELK